MPPEWRAKIAARNLKTEIPDTKRCTRCKIVQPQENYGRRPRKEGHYLLKSYCRKCERLANNDKNRRFPDRLREANRLGSFRRRGTTEGEYNRLFAEQGGLCAICRGAPMPHKRLGVDHCHKIGRIRGLLCDACNRGIGLMGDDPARLMAAITYLTSKHIDL